MKTKIYMFGLLLAILCSCSSPQYLPDYNNIDIGTRGAYIRIEKNDKSLPILGELIAVDSNKIVVLSEADTNCVEVPISTIRNYRLRYAKPKHYGWSIPIYSLASLGHGFFAVISLPVNLAVTIVVTAKGEQDYTYSNNDLSLDSVKDFARFPQGIPPNVTLENIK